MRKLLFLVAGATAALTAVPAAVTPSKPTTGTFGVIAAAPTETRTADGTTFITLQRTAMLTGTFTGVTTDTVNVVMHANGTTSIHGVGSCVCTVEGRTGTFEYRFRGAGTFPTSVSGTYVAGHGTGGLEGLHGVGRFSGTFLLAALDGQYHIE